MKKTFSKKSEKAQSALELAFSLPILILLVMGTVEVVLAGRAYLALLESTTVGSRLGSAGETYYDDHDIFLLTTQVMSQEGYDTSGLVDIIVVRAELVNGDTIQNYRVAKMLGSSRDPALSQTLLLNRMSSGDPNINIVGVEVLYDHRLLYGFDSMLPDPIVLRAYTIQIVP